MAPGVFIAHTHNDWFDYLSRIAERDGDGPLRLDEVNFWSPRSVKPIKHFELGEPVFFRLGATAGAGARHIVGYGFYADHLDSINVRLAWELFGPKNGAPDLSSLARILGRRSLDDLRRPLGSMLLRDATFWPDHQWIPWGPERGYANQGIQKGRTDRDPANVALLMGLVAQDGQRVPADLAPDFTPLTVDERTRTQVTHVRREGQGVFRARLLKAYDGRCAITGEHTEPVLDAAHIQPYLGPASNHVQNGLLLTKEFHTLFDRGLVAVEPLRSGDYQVRVSGLLKELWNNGRRYREYDGETLEVVPAEARLRPSREALEWHREERFERGV